MIYCTYEQYQAMGGSMAEEDFSLWGPRASRKIDQLTMGRAARYAQQQKDELAEACGQIADILHNAQASRVSSGALVSASNDGYKRLARMLYTGLYPTLLEMTLTIFCIGGYANAGSRYGYYDIP